MTITDYSVLIARVRAYTGYDEIDISDAVIQVFLDDAVVILSHDVGYTYSELVPHDNFVICLYACGAGVNYVNGPNVKKIDVGDTEIQFGGPSGGIASNSYLEDFWKEVGNMDASGGLAKSTWNLSKYYPVDLNKDHKRYRRIDNVSVSPDADEHYLEGEIVVIEEGDGPDV